MASHFNKHVLPDDQNHQQAEQNHKYQSYHDFDHNNLRLKELAFFSQIAIFSVLTVIAAFCLLSYNIEVYLTFPIAMLISLAITSIIYQIIISLLRK